MTTAASCASCRFWLEAGPKTQTACGRESAYTSTDLGAGLCRRLPPVSHAWPEDITDAVNASRYPATWDDDWCGEHQSDIEAERAELRRQTIELYSRPNRPLVETW